MFTHGHARAGSRCGNRAARAKLAVMDCPARPMHWSWLEPQALSKNDGRSNKCRACWGLYGPSGTSTVRSASAVAPLIPQPALGLSRATVYRVLVGDADG